MNIIQKDDYMDEEEVIEINKLLEETNRLLDEEVSIYSDEEVEALIMMSEELLTENEHLRELVREQEQTISLLRKQIAAFKENNNRLLNLCKRLEHIKYI